MYIDFVSILFLPQGEAGPEGPRGYPGSKGNKVREECGKEWDWAGLGWAGLGWTGLSSFVVYSGVFCYCDH